MVSAMGACECGCGRRTNVYRGRRQRFIQGHHLHLTRNPDFPFRFDARQGRWFVTTRDGNSYPWALLVMWNVLGREPLDDEQIHHVNEDKTDDRPENLAVLSPGAHTRLHLSTRSSSKVVRHCEHCGAAYERYPSQAVSTRFCSRTCRGAAQSAGTFLTGRALVAARRAADV